ncbi:hypothetical protein RUM44_013641 [Polyplax serrata]|uniref:Uncharacterized protein n=1 Tax=Polyplax serrata TaxID=468196 RepID=A0ABR1BES0_POLSC
MVESTSTLLKCSRRCSTRCSEGQRGSPLTNALLTRRRRHKTVHFGDFTDKIGSYCTDQLPNCCKLSRFCGGGNGGINSKNCPICSNSLRNGNGNFCGLSPCFPYSSGLQG